MQVKETLQKDGTGSVVHVDVLSHVGRVRRDNQDRVGHAACPSIQMAVVADGVGGEAGGARAAECAVEEYAAILASCAEVPPDVDAAEALQRATATIQAKIAGMRESDPALSAMASTVAVVCLQASRATVGHLGDARAYLFRSGKLRRITQDHSVVQQMVSKGLITETESRTHPQGHILTHSLGQPGSLLEITTLPTVEGDVFLLCSDGLWSCVTDEMLSQELGKQSPDLAQTAQRLLELALAKGAPDNVSLALLQIWREVPAASAPFPLSPDRQGRSSSQRSNMLIGAGFLALTGILVWLLLRHGPLR